MKRLVAASVMLALFVGSAATAHVPGRVNCAKLFTVAHTEATARDVYAGTRTVTLAKLQRLGHMELCQARIAHRDRVRAYSHNQAALHAQRVAHAATVVPSSTSMSKLEACIIKAESGGNPQAVNGDHAGIGQWDPAAWAQDGGLRFGRSPLDATYAEQELILRGEGMTGMEAQQAAFDPC